MADYLDYIEAHKHCRNHRQEVLSSKVCGCFYCQEMFHPDEIIDWVDPPKGETVTNENGETALCPKCTIDSVIGDASGYMITYLLLENMNRLWFS